MFSSQIVPGVAVADAERVVASPAGCLIKRIPEKVQTFQIKVRDRIKLGTAQRVW